MEKNYPLPAICWLKVTDYMHGWLQYELGGEARVKEQRVVCVQHMPGARDILRMETTEDTTAQKPVDTAMSATLRNCIAAGLVLNADEVTQLYGINKEALQLFIPIECPKMCLTKNGVLRPWTQDTTFSHKQATALQRLLREAFWQAVAEYDRQYAREHQGEKYAQVDMIEAFCERTSTPDLYAEAMRREWQRRCKRIKDLSAKHP